MRTLPTLGLVLVVLLLAGCLPQLPPEPPPTPVPTLLFASDEEALAAAEATYTAYQDLAAEILQDGGRGGERISAVTTADFLDASIKGFIRAERAGWRTVGRSTFRNMVVQSFDSEADVATVVVYVCEDVSNVEIFGPSGQSLVSPDRPDTAIMQVVLDRSPDGSMLLIADRQVWSNQPC